MKKSKLFLACMAGLLGATTFVFAGCSGNTDGTEGGGDVGGGGGGGGGGGQTTPVDPEVTDPVLNTMSTYFSGARVLLKQGTILNENNVQTQFSELLDRQFSVLAEDLLYRLQIVYGEGTYGETSEYKDLTLLNGNYSYNGNSAKVLKNILLTNGEHIGTHDVVSNKTYQNLDCLQCYQEILDDGSQLDMNNVDTIKLEGAIFGKYTTFADRTNYLENNLNIEKQWQITNLQDSSAINKIKMAIAKAVAGDSDYVNASYNQVDYNNTLAKIDKLGFNNEITDKVVEIINNKVIGSSLIQENLNIYNSFTDEEKHTIINSLSNEKRLFKGYNIVVPAIVNMALNNTFENTSVSLYPSVGNTKSEIFDFTKLTNANAYDEVYLMPSNKNVKPTKINLKVTADANSIGKTISVYATVRNAAGVVYQRTLVGNITLTEAGDELTVTLDTETIGKFTGNSTINFGATSLFGTNNEMPNDETLYGVNYIKFDFENSGNAKFGLEFKGMYDKMNRS